MFLDTLDSFRWFQVVEECYWTFQLLTQRGVFFLKGENSVVSAEFDGIEQSPSSSKTGLNPAAKVFKAKKKDPVLYLKILPEKNLVFYLGFFSKILYFIVSKL